MLVASLATVIASPHSHFHGSVLVLAPLALSLARPMGEGCGTWPRRLMLGSGCLLGIVILLFRTLSWLLVPHFLLAMALLILEVRGQQGKGGGHGVSARACSRST